MFCFVLFVSLIWHACYPQKAQDILYPFMLLLSLYTLYHAVCIFLCDFGYGLAEEREWMGGT